MKHRNSNANNSELECNSDRNYLQNVPDKHTPVEKLKTITDKDSVNYNEESLSNCNNLDSFSYGFNRSVDNLSVGEDKGIESDKMNCISSYIYDRSF